MKNLDDVYNHLDKIAESNPNLADDVLAATRAIKVFSNHTDLLPEVDVLLNTVINVTYRESPRTITLEFRNGGLIYFEYGGSSIDDPHLLFKEMAKLL